MGLTAARISCRVLHQTVFQEVQILSSWTHHTLAHRVTTHSTQPALSVMASPVTAASAAQLPACLTRALLVLAVTMLVTPTQSTLNKTLSNLQPLWLQCFHSSMPVVTCSFSGLTYSKEACHPTLTEASCHLLVRIQHQHLLVAAGHGTLYLCSRMRMAVCVSSTARCLNTAGTRITAT